MLIAGLGNLGIDDMPQAANSLNFAPRIDTPTLMINGRKDFVFPYETSQTPLFELLGTPDENKRHIVYDGDHYQIPGSAITRDMTGWFDEYLGPVD